MVCDGHKIFVIINSAKFNPNKLQDKDTGFDSYS